ncbi:MAG: hypothetical protein AAF602_30020 [Myxococcota bacterium]
MEAFDQSLSKHLARGYVPVGEPQRRKLEDMRDGIALPVETGSCYALVISLGEDAVVSEHARKGTVIRFRNGEETFHNAGGISDVGGIGGGCSDRHGEAHFDVIAIWGSSTDESRLFDLGTGSYTAQLMVRRLTAEQQAQRKERQAQQDAAMEAASRRRAQEACATCGGDYRSCVVRVATGRVSPAEASCRGDFFDCLERRAVDPQRCGG